MDADANANANVNADAGGSTIALDEICSSELMSGPIRPKIELDQAFMPVLVTSNFDDDLIENERASMETPFSH